MTRRTTVGLALVAAALGAVAAGVRRRAGSPATASPWLAPTDTVPEAPLPLATQRHGSRADRGLASSVRMDLSRAREQDLDPVVEFLTFVQQQRGDTSHLLFVRYDDLDVLAEQQGEPVSEFVSRLDHLGVVVSNN